MFKLPFAGRRNYKDKNCDKLTFQAGQKVTEVQMYYDDYVTALRLDIKGLGKIFLGTKKSQDRV